MFDCLVKIPFEQVNNELYKLLYFVVVKSYLDTSIKSLVSLKYKTLYSRLHFKPWVHPISLKLYKSSLIKQIGFVLFAYH